jgi:hypothetical protein
MSINVNVPLSRPSQNPKDNVYYNIDFVNKDENKQVVPIQFSERTSIPVLDRPSDYQLAVTRFSLPGEFIPVMLWDPEGKGAWNADTNPGSKVDKFEVVMEFDGEVKRAYLPQPVNANPANVSPLYGPNFSVWNYKEFVDSFNTALATAFGDLKTAKPLAPPTAPPFVEYDASTRLCSLYAETLYDTGGPLVPPQPPTIKVYLNQNLYSLFPSWNTFRDNIAGEVLYQLTITNTGTNSLTVAGLSAYQMEQEFSTVALWNDFDEVIFETGSIPVNPEYDPKPNNTVTRNLVTDYVPKEQLNSRDQIQYDGVGWKRFTDLESNYPLREISVNVLWKTTWGDRYPVYIGYNDNFSMKLLFRKKLGLQLEDVYGTYDD